MNRGFTLIETLLAIGIFTIISLGIYFSYSNILDVIVSSQANLVALSAIDNELEVIRNMKYQDVGIQGGSPAGKLVAEKIIQQSGIPFTLKTYVRNIDDPFDGTIGGTPNDLASADYKLIELELSCPACPRFSTRTVTTRVAPLNLEGLTKNGALFVNVFDASGQPISGANVNIINNSVNPAININDITGVNGMLQLVDIATSSAKYEVTVTKPGYSTDKTYQPGVPGNPNPTKPHATVANQQVTQISFAIDRTSVLNLATNDQMCVPVASVDYIQTGSKLIGTDPDVFKYLATHVTDANGYKTIDNLEWDTYAFQNIDPAFDISGMSPLSPLTIDPFTSKVITWVMEPKNPSALLVTVQDQNGQFINDASVQLTKTGFDQTKMSGRRTVTHTDWTGSLNTTSKTPNLETDNPAGSITVKFIGGKYATSSEEFVSSTIDFGTSNTLFYNLSWTPVSQPPQTGADSLKIQIAANNDNLNWNFVGPDGTLGTYYTTSNIPIHASHNGKRYMRYKLYVQTINDQFTPRLDDITIEFHSSCGLDGQAYFSGLVNGTYTLTIQKTGFQTITDTNVAISGGWKIYKATLLP